MAKCRSQLTSSRQWSYPVWQLSATAVSYPWLVPYLKLQTLARCGRQHWQPPSPSPTDAGSHISQRVARQWQRSTLADRLRAGSCWCLPFLDKTNACLSSSFYSVGGCLATSIRGPEGCWAEPSSTLALCPISAGRREQAVLSPGKVQMSSFSSSVHRWELTQLSPRKQFPRQERAAEPSHTMLQGWVVRQLGAMS